METDQNKNKSRRDFLITTTALAGGFASLFLLKPFKVLGGDTTDVVAAKDVKKLAGRPKEDHWFGFGFDNSLCIGCGSCAKACKAENNVPKEPFYFRTWVEQYVVKNDETIKVDSPNGAIDGLKQSVDDKEVFKAFFVPKTCNHCYKSPCTQVCPVGATFVSPEGVVLVDEKYCVGCGYCVQACPYGCRYIHPVKHTVDKCSLCYHRIMQGTAPACVDVCPTGARTYGDLRDKTGSLVMFIKNHKCRVLKPHLNTGSKLFYNDLAEEVR